MMTLLIKEPIYEKPPSQVNLKIASRNIMSEAKTSYPDVLYFFQEQLFEVCLEFNIDSTQGDKRVRMHFLLSNPVKSQTKMRFPMLFLASKDPKNFLGVYVLPEHENVSLMCFQLYLEKSPCVPFFKNFFTVSIRQKKSSFFSDKIESKIYFWTRIKQAIHMERFVGGGARRLRLNPCMHTCANNLSLKSGSIFFSRFSGDNV